MPKSLAQFVAENPEADEDDYSTYRSAASVPSVPSVVSAPDFRARYAPETAGMPANLAAIASRNLAAEDASIAKVNAVSRLLPQSPDSSLPQSEIGNRQSAIPTTLTDLHTSDISERRAALDDQKKQIQAKLGIIQPRDAGLAAVVLAGPKERKDLLTNWQMLEKESDNLLREEQIATTAKARSAHENFSRQKHIDAANDFTALTGELTDIRKTTKRGTPEREEAISKAVANHPAGFTVKAGQELVRRMSQEHDAAATIIPPGYEKVPSTVQEGGKVNYKLAPKGTVEQEAIETELKDKYGLTPAQIKAPGNIESGNLDKDGNFVNANKGSHFRVKAKDGDFVIPRAEFEKFGGHVGEADKIASAAPAAVPATPPVPAREKGQVYDTPRGKMKWTGTGWVQP